MDTRIYTKLCDTKTKYFIPLINVKASGGILDANANNTDEETPRASKKAQITLSGATPADKTDKETPRASDIAT